MKKWNDPTDSIQYTQFTNQAKKNSILKSKKVKKEFKISLLLYVLYQRFVKMK